MTAIEKISGGKQAARRRWQETSWDAEIQPKLRVGAFDITDESERRGLRRKGAYERTAGWRTEGCGGGSGNEQR